MEWDKRGWKELPVVQEVDADTVNANYYRVKEEVRSWSRRKWSGYREIRRWRDLW